jgi:hypothetical protein
VNLLIRADEASALLDKVDAQGGAVLGESKVSNEFLRSGQIRPF